MQITILGQSFAITCEGRDQKRLEDLAAALDARLARFPAETDALSRLVLAALSLLDETQTTGAALALARSEIERLTDLLVDAKLEAKLGASGVQKPDEQRGRVNALRLGA
jgi:cell division protein ZapA (FtsZ GTPase activity inhibitor)